MTWKVFGGEHVQFYEAVLAHHKKNKSKSAHNIEPGTLLHAHIRRGLGYLASGTEIKSINEFVAKWLMLARLSP